MNIVKYPAYSGNYTKGRSGKKVSEITLHHMAARWTAQRCGESFQVVGRNGSTHYGVGYDGSYGQFVEESDTAWANSNWDANCRSVTIETSNDPYGGNWLVNDLTLNNLIDLVVDIAKRNNLLPLVKGVNLTWHSMYTATACPGSYLLSKMDYICAEANRRAVGGGSTYYKETPVMCTYQAYSGGRWMGNVSQHNINDSVNGYAGILGQPVSGVYCSSDMVDIYYKVRIRDTGKWLPEVKNREDYAGILGQSIDGIMFRSNATRVNYQAHDKAHGWLPPVSGYSESDYDRGHAGWTGYDIDAIMVWADPIVELIATEAPIEPVITSPEILETAPIADTQTPALGTQLYRVRVDWNDTKSQIGAFSNLDSAKNVADLNVMSGHKVYDGVGNVVYNPVVYNPVVSAPEEALGENIYETDPVDNVEDVSEIHFEEIPEEISKEIPPEEGGAEVSDVPVDDSLEIISEYKDERNSESLLKTFVAFLKALLDIFFKRK